MKKIVHRQRKCMLKLIVIVVSVLLAGCVSMKNIEANVSKMYNVPSSGTSEFDNTKHIRMSNMVCSKNTVMFELYQDTEKSKAGLVLLEAGSKSIDNIGNGKSLHLKVNDKVYSFESFDSITEHENISSYYGVNQYFSHKSYLIPESIIRDMATSNKFLVKVNLLNKTFLEDKCSDITLQEAKANNLSSGHKLTQHDVDFSNSILAGSGFREFVRMIDTTKW